MKLVREQLEPSFTWIKVSDEKQNAWDNRKKGVFEFLDSALDKSVRRGNIWYNENDEWVFEQDDKNGILQISNIRIWSVLGSKYGLNYNEIRELIIGWMKEHTQWHTLTPAGFALSFLVLMKEHTK